MGDGGRMCVCGRVVRGRVGGGVERDEGGGGWWGSMEIHSKLSIRPHLSLIEAATVNLKSQALIWLRLTRGGPNE